MKLTNTVSSFSNLRQRIDGNIITRRSINYRMNESIHALSKLDTHLRDMAICINQSGVQYALAENRILSVFRETVGSPKNDSSGYLVGTLLSWGIQQAKATQIDLLEWKDAIKLTQELYEKTNELNDKFLRGMYSWLKHGYRFEVHGDFVRIFGSRNVTGYLGEAYREWRIGDLLTGTRYHIDNQVLAKYFKPSAAIFEELKDTYNVLDPKAWKNSLKGGGVLSAVMTVGGSVFDYGWGENKQTGLASTEFASDLFVESAIAVTTTAVSTAAGIWAAGAVGAATGSVIPGLGTAVGFVAAAGIFALSKTEAGKTATKWTKEKVNDAIEGGIDIAGQAYQGAKGLAQEAYQRAGELRDEAVNSIKDISYDAKKVVDDAARLVANAADAAQDAIGGAVNKFIDGFKSPFSWR
ncbi:hypothetical protein [Paenibacillus alginolyticus]|uniref:hypothetical protein n=1 Tax=Paenibacillus alginolyticus TaxID=59839 RepID=UPI002DBD1766|nr:hypothetical protein [Paenibacillus alginolyticus]MEC0144245.1 hypothetical protein [Paenibacillus alginolyticus]